MSYRSFAYGHHARSLPIHRIDRDAVRRVKVDKLLARFDHHTFDDVVARVSQRIAADDRTEDALTEPVTQGGQGRTADELEDTASAFGWFIFIGACCLAWYAIGWTGLHMYRAIFGN